MRTALAALLAGTLAVAAGCGGTTRVTLPVTVTDSHGTPLPGASVELGGVRGTTDPTGVASLELGPGSYRLTASRDGYLDGSRTLTVSGGRQPLVRIALRYAPSLGSFVRQPSSAEWDVLTVSAVRPLRAVLHVYRWDCGTSGWSDRSAPAGPAPDADALATAAGTIALAAPGRLGPGWLPDGGTLLPDRSPGAEPPGACRGASPTWRVPIGNVGPAVFSEAGLRTFAAELGQPVYWSGPRAGVRYELTRTGASGAVYLRYLPPGVAPGASLKLEIVATYRVRDAYALTLLGGRRPGSVEVAVQGATAYFPKSHPTNVYVAFPGSDFQVEVYAPAARLARDLVASGRIRAVGN